MNKKIFIIALVVVFCVSLAFNVYLIFMNVKNQNTLNQYQANRNIMNFRNEFEEKILLSDQEVDFNTRLVLETGVRSLNDPEILKQWEVFTGSQTKDEATKQAKVLLELLIRKTS